MPRSCSSFPYRSSPRTRGTATQVTGAETCKARAAAQGTDGLMAPPRVVVFAALPPLVLGLRRAFIAAIGLAELVLGSLFYLRPQLAFGLLGRPVLDPVIGRQYGLFLVSVALMYAILASDPVRYRRLIWVAIAQRVAEFGGAVSDWRAGALSASSFILVAGTEVGLVVLLACCAAGSASRRTERVAQAPLDVWLARALNAFGGLQLFWALLSTICVQLGARLLGWKLHDAYTTQQQGFALMVIGLTSLFAGSDVHRNRALIWVPICSQALGIANAVYELRSGTITLTIAIVQWAIEGVIITTLLSLAAPEREFDRRTPTVSPLV